MKYKKYHELSDAEYQVLRNIARKVGHGVRYIELQYVHWNIGDSIDKNIEKEFEMAFLGDTKSMHQGDKPSNYVIEKKAQFSLVLQSHIRRSLQNTPKVLSKPKRDLIINTDDITNLRIELNRADFSYDKFLERI